MPIRFMKGGKSSFDFHTLRLCKTCQNSFTGRFCNVCGEKIVEPEDKAIKAFMGSVINAFTFLDSKFLHTLKLMLVKTGYVTRQYIDGVRVPFVKPVSMFFVVNLIYFLFPIADTFNSRLTTQMNYLPYSELATQIVEKRLTSDATTLEEFEVRYNQQSTSMAKLLLIIFVFLMAIPIMLLNFSKERFFIDHVTTSLEFNSLLILIFLILLPLPIIFLDALLTPKTHSINLLLDDQTYSFIAAFICVLLFYFLERRVYQQRVIWSILKAIALLPCLFLMLQTYRAILFFTTMWTL